MDPPKSTRKDLKETGRTRRTGNWKLPGLKRGELDLRPEKKEELDVEKMEERERIRVTQDEDSRNNNKREERTRRRGGRLLVPPLSSPGPGAHAPKLGSLGPNSGRGL